MVLPIIKLYVITTELGTVNCSYGVLISIIGTSDSEFMKDENYLSGAKIRVIWPKNS